MIVLGGARIVGTHCGLFRSGRSFAGDLREILSGVAAAAGTDWSDFRRGGAPVRLAMLAAAAARSDLAEMPDPERSGILGWNGAGCRSENALFWRDCREHDGLGRGGLFVGTLNSIPVCEAAIMLGLHGASGYLAGEDWRENAEGFLHCHKLASLLMMEIRAESADALWLAPEGEGIRLPDGRTDFGECCAKLLRREAAS